MSATGPPLLIQSSKDESHPYYFMSEGKLECHPSVIFFFSSLIPL